MDGFREVAYLDAFLTMCYSCVLLRRAKRFRAFSNAYREMLYEHAEAATWSMRRFTSVEARRARWAREAVASMCYIWCGCMTEDAAMIAFSWKGQVSSPNMKRCVPAQ